MTTFDKREEGFEKQFAHDEELRFKATARRNKQVVMSDFEESGEDDVFRKVRKDLDAKGVAQSDHQIRRTMDELMAQAIAQIKAGT